MVYFSNVKTSENCFSHSSIVEQPTGSHVVAIPVSKSSILSSFIEIRNVERLVSKNRLYRSVEIALKQGLNSFYQQ